MSEWRKVTWGDVCELRYGKALREYGPASAKTQVFGTNGPIGWTEREPLSEGPRPIVGRKGAVRGVHLAKRPFWVIDTAFWLSPCDELDPIFAYYNLLTVDINRMDSGSALPSLTREHLYAVNLTLPPLSEQERIAGVLMAFDDLIESNLRIVRALDEFGCSVVADVQASNSEHVTLAEACSVIESGRRPKGGVSGIGVGIPSLGAESINGMTPFKFNKTKYVPAEFAMSMRRGVVEDLDVLVYKDGGRPGEFSPDISIVGAGYPFDQMVINEHVFRIRAKAPLGQGYLYFWLSTEIMMDRMREIGSRTAAIPGMNSKNFSALPIVIPPEAWCEKNIPALEDVVQTCLELLSDCRNLARQRDQLLPLLMSGSVRVEALEEGPTQ